MPLTVTLSDDDAQQVRAILLTHAEMQDRQTVDNEQLRGQLQKDPTSKSSAMIEDLEDAHEDLIEDRDNLKRIADLFGHE